MPDRQKIIQQVFEESAETIHLRATAYGDDSHQSISIALAAMFPSGLTLATPDDFSRFLLFLNAVGKLNRYAANFQNGGHRDSIHDSGNYAKLLEAEDIYIRERYKGEDD